MMGQPKERMGDSEGQPSSSSSAFTMPLRSNSEDTHTGDTEKSLPPSNPLVAIGRSLVAGLRSLTGYLYRSIVALVAEFIADVFSHPRLRRIFVDIVVAAMNAFMDQDDIGTKFDDTARRVIYDTEKARETSHAIGREVVPMVAGFVGGVAHSLKPSAIRKRKEKRKKRASRLDSAGSSKLGLDSEPIVSDLTALGSSEGGTETGEDFDDAMEKAFSRSRSRSKKTK